MFIADFIYAVVFVVRSYVPVKCRYVARPYHTYIYFARLQNVFAKMSKMIAGQKKNKKTKENNLYNRRIVGVEYWRWNCDLNL